MLRRKWPRRILTGVAVAVGAAILLVLLLLLFLDSLVEKGVRAAGPPLLGVSTKLSGASIRPLAGKVDLRGLFVGNPEGFSSPSFVQIQRIRVGASVPALLKKEVHLQEVLIDGPEFTFECKGIGRDWNYQRVLDHLEKKEKKTPGDEPRKTGEEKQPLLMKIELLRITNARVNVVVAGKRLPSLTIGGITLRNLSEDGKAIPPERIILAVLREIVVPAEKMIDLGKLRESAEEAVTSITNQAGRTAGEIRESVKGVQKEIGDLLRKPAKRSEEKK